MEYLQKIIQEEISKRLDEGFFDRLLRGDDDYKKKQEQEHINKALQDFNQSLMNVCGNLLRYGQTIQDYQSVRTSMELEKYAEQYIASLSGYIYKINELEGDILVADDTDGGGYEQETPRANVPIAPTYVPQEVEPENEPQETEQEPDDDDGWDYRGFSQGNPIDGPENDTEQEEDAEFVPKPTVKRNSQGKMIVSFDGGSMEYSPGNSVYKIHVSEEDADVGYFELVEDDIARQLVLMDMNDYLFPCCDGEPLSGARSIVTKERGTVRYNQHDEKWYVTKKAKIEFVR